MSSDPSLAVRFDSVHKVYDRAPRSVRWRAAAPWLREEMRQPHTALDGFDLRVLPGESVGIIGPNGAGKSTALRLVAGITRPTSGTVDVAGSVGAMIELGVGFHPELTGSENVWCGLITRGYRPHEIRHALPEVVGFAGLEHAMDTPVKRYSLGMRARLAFAVATHASADVLAVDEVLAVGDRDFQDRCIDRIRTMVDAGSALLFVSHDTMLVAHLCTRAVQVRGGRVVDDGPADEVVERYLSRSSKGYRPSRDAPMRFVEVTAPSSLDSWSPIEITAEVEVTRPNHEPTIGIDMSLPTVAPDVVLASSQDAIAALRGPGRYRLRGTSGPIGVDSGDFRLAIHLVDAHRQRTCGIRELDITIPGGRIGGRPGLNVEPRLDIAEITPETVPDAHRFDRIRPEWSGPADTPVAISVRRVSKRYRAGTARRGNVALAWPRRREMPVHSDDVVALDDVSFDLHAGEGLGVIGPNGAGKSTLLQVLASLTRPDTGTVTAGGPTLPLLDVAAGFHPDLTGSENTRVLGRLLGLSPSDLAAAMPDIVDTAGIGDAMDAPVKQYSSGMRARLGFAITMAVPATTLLIDELLAVGDEEFRTKALRIVDDRRRRGAAVVFVSHELRLVEELCTRVIRLESGKLVDDGPAAQIIDAYSSPSWARGVHDATSGIRLHPLHVTQRHISVGGRLEFDGVIEVEQPSPTARLALAYQAAPPDRSKTLLLADRAELSMYNRTLIHPGGQLARGGWYRYHCTVDHNEFTGEIDLVVSLIDGDEVLADAWQQVTVGAARPEGFPSLNLSFDWQVERIDDGSPT